MSRWLLQMLLALVLGFGLGCFGPESHQTDRDGTINPQLRRVLDLAPLEHPIWASPSRMYAYHNGIVEVVIDSTTLNYRSRVEFDFPYYIWTMSYDRASRKILIIYDDGSLSSNFKAARVSLADQRVVVDDDLVDAGAVPWGIASWPGKPGIVYYGVTLGSNVRGFYWRRVAEIDSLILAVELDPPAARGMAIDPTGRRLFFSQGTHPTTFFELDLTQTNAQPAAITQRMGSGGAVVPHPTNPNLLLFNYYFRGGGSTPPQSHIELFNLATKESRDLDVRTRTSEGLFMLNEHPWWSPDGRHFVFGAATFSGEGDQSWMELWIYQNLDR